MPLAHERAKLQNLRETCKGDKDKQADIKAQMEQLGRQIAEFGSQVVVAELPKKIIDAHNKLVDLVNSKSQSTKKWRHLTNYTNTSWKKLL